MDFTSGKDESEVEMLQHQWLSQVDSDDTDSTTKYLPEVAENLTRSTSTYCLHCWVKDEGG